MEKQKLVIKAFEALGYKPIIDDEGDVMIRYQMKNIYAINGDEDESYLVLTLLQFMEIEEDEEHIALTVCNKLTRELKLVKVYVDNTFKNISANCEFYYTDEESLKSNIEKSLKILGIIRTLYRKTEKEIVEP